MTIYASLLIAYAFFACVYWLWTAVGAVRIARAVPVLAKTQPSEPASWPKLSIVIPACNEAESLESAVITILAQDYPDLEVVLVDDRSTDGTAEIVNRLAADCRVRALHVTQLPDGWLGKVHAMDQGVQCSEGEWLLFTDADVHFAPGTLRRAVAFAMERGVDHVAAMPEMWPSTLLVDATIAMFLRGFPVGTRCWAVEDPRSTAYIGVGAFNLVRRAALDRTEGFSWLRLEVADDMGLGLMLKRSGARSCLVNGTGLVGLYWYRSIAEMARGSEKGYSSLARCSFVRMLFIGLVILALEWAPLVMLLPLGVPWLWPAGVVMIGCAAAIAMIYRRWSGPQRILPLLLAPAAAALGLVLTVRAGWLGWRRGGVMWRGTLYPSALLRSGSRVRFP